MNVPFSTRNKLKKPRLVYLIMHVHSQVTCFLCCLELLTGPCKWRFVEILWGWFILDLSMRWGMERMWCWLLVEGVTTIGAYLFSIIERLTFHFWMSHTSHNSGYHRMGVHQNLTRRCNYTYTRFLHAPPPLASCSNPLQASNGASIFECRLTNPIKVIIKVVIFLYVVINQHLFFFNGNIYQSTRCRRILGFKWNYLTLRNSSNTFIL